MRALLDTYTFLWWVDNDVRLSAYARQFISDGANELFFSVASSWEIAIKAQLGKLTLPTDLERFFIEQLAQNHLIAMPIHLHHTLGVYRLPPLHRDPFDRILIAQSRAEDLPILTADPLIRQYNAHTIW